MRCEEEVTAMYIGNAGTRKLWDEIRPWMQGAKLREDAPEDIKEQ